MHNRRMQAPVTRVELHMHDIPALKMQVAGLPTFAVQVTGENQTTFTRTNKNLYI
jgi:hypothetical protein